MFGGSISEQEKTLFSWSTRKGGLGICDPVHFHSASIERTAKIVSSIKGKEKFSVLEHRAVVVKTKAKLKKHRIEQDQRKLEGALEQMDGKTSGWLNVLPIACHQFDPSVVEFRDALLPPPPENAL